MSKHNYAVVYGGQFMKGVSRADATRGFANLYRIDEARAAELLARRHLVLKHGLPENLARRYQQAYADVGVVTQIQIQRGASEKRKAPEPEQVGPTGDPAATVVMPVAHDGTSLRNPPTDSGPGALERTVVQEVIDLDDDRSFDDGPAYPEPAPAVNPERPRGATRVLHAETEEELDRADARAETRPVGTAGAQAAAAADYAASTPTGEQPVVTMDSAPGQPDQAAGGEAAAADGRDRRPFIFHGETGEYFRIWIVNIALSILTLGIYSAWAKVRNLRYFYGNTEVADARFEFHGKPLAILIGRIIAVSVFVGYSLLSQFAPLLALPLIPVFLFGMPWLVNRSLAFRYRNTSYRGIRFGFIGNYWRAFMAFVIWPIIGALSLGLALPYVFYVQARYVIGNARFGRSGFQPEFGAGAFYRIVLGAMGIFFGGMFAVFGVGWLLMGQGSSIGALLFVPLLLVIYAVAFAFLQARLPNLIYDQTRLGPHGFESRLETLPMTQLYITNTLALVLTLGLALPWVKIRMANYRADHLTLLAADDLESFLADEQQQVNALGEEMGEIFDVDLGM